MENLLFRCKRCLFPNTKPDLHFDENGICMACKYTDYYHGEIDWDKRKELFYTLIERVKLSNKNSDSEYDCTIAVSGGKDSTYQTYLITEVAGLKPLLLNFEPSCPTENGKYNLQNLVNAFNCDLIQMKKSPTYRKLARIGFDVVGDHEWPNHVGCYVWPTQMACKLKIPITFYGEPRGIIGLGRWDSLIEENVEEVTRSIVEQYTGMGGYRLSDIMQYDESIKQQDVLPYVYPSKEEMDKFDMKVYDLGHFFPWEFQDNIRTVKEYGWKAADTHNEGTFANWEDIDCGFMPIHQYFKFIKFGYARATDHAAYEIRMERMTQAEAKDLIMEYDWRLPRRHFQEFLDFIEITERYFFETVDRFANPVLFKKNKKGNFMHKWDGNLILDDIWYKSFDV